jgi:hypothetical protein
MRRLPVACRLLAAHLQDFNPALPNPVQDAWRAGSEGEDAQTRNLYDAGSLRLEDVLDRI